MRSGAARFQLRSKCPGKPTTPGKRRSVPSQPFRQSCDALRYRPQNLARARRAQRLATRRPATERSCACPKPKAALRAVRHARFREGRSESRPGRLPRASAALRVTTRFSLRVGCTNRKLRFRSSVPRRRPGGAPSERPGKPAAAAVVTPSVRGQLTHHPESAPHLSPRRARGSRPAQTWTEAGGRRVANGYDGPRSTVCRYGFPPWLDYG